MSRTKPTPHPFTRNPDLPPDSKGRHVCLCGLLGEPGEVITDT